MLDETELRHANWVSGHILQVWCLRAAPEGYTGGLSEVTAPRRGLAEKVHVLARPIRFDDQRRLQLPDPLPHPECYHRSGIGKLGHGRRRGVARVYGDGGHTYGLILLKNPREPVTDPQEWVFRHGLSTKSGHP